MDVDTDQPLGTPTWIDRGVPDLDRCAGSYGAVFVEFDVGPRNDLVTPSPGPPASSTPRSSSSRSRATRPCRRDFTFLRRPDGHEAGGVMGAPGRTAAWSTTFEVPGTDEPVQRALDPGGTSDVAKDFLYGRLATITDPFGAEFSIITRPER